jgi:hypothetical protein
LRHLSADDSLDFQKHPPAENRSGLISKLKFSILLKWELLRWAMYQAKSSSQICPKCNKPMQLLLTRGERQRALRCADCGQPDLMQNADVQGWLKGELKNGQ